VEVTALIVPVENDGEDEMDELSGWLSSVSPIYLFISAGSSRNKNEGSAADSPWERYTACTDCEEELKLRIHRKLRLIWSASIAIPTHEPCGFTAAGFILLSYNAINKRRFIISLLRLILHEITIYPGFIDGVYIVVVIMKSGIIFWKEACDMIKKYRDILFSDSQLGPYRSKAEAVDTATAHHTV
jgi:hypothetical protein